MATDVDKPYRYAECGLENVYVHGLSPLTDDEGEEVYGIQNVNGLHKAIASSIVTYSAAMSGKQLRFLRTEMGFTQAEVGKMVHKEALTVGRWEREECPIDTNADTIIRLVAIERLSLKPELSVEDLAGLSVQKAAPHVIDIDGEDPKNYRPLAA
ncbi:MAG: hypothetical protein JKY27_13655 [Magnetovibrio sp.]|nr:hypothetical protein [Magnetovibrio sp.]